MTKEDKQIIERAVKEEWRIGDRTRLKRLLEKNLKQYRENVELKNENRLLGERCNQLLKDKGDLTDKVQELEQQIEKMKRHCNCKHRDSEGYCEVKRTYLMDLSYDGCDKWELEND